MPPDLDVHIRTAGTWDTAGLVDAMTAALERALLVWWLHPRPVSRTRSVREHVRHRTGQVHARVVERDGEIVAGAAWITCTTGSQSPAGLEVPGHTPDPRRGAYLHTLLEDAHPCQPHRHLLLLAVRPGQQRRGLGTSLLADSFQEPGSGPTIPHYAVLPINLVSAATQAGYQPAGPSIRVARDLILQPMLSDPPGQWAPPPRSRTGQATSYVRNHPCAHAAPPAPPHPARPDRPDGPPPRTVNHLSSAPGGPADALPQQATTRTAPPVSGGR